MSSPHLMWSSSAIGVALAPLLATCALFSDSSVSPPLENTPPVTIITRGGSELADDLGATVAEGEEIRLDIRVVDADGDAVSLLPIQQPPGGELFQSGEGVYVFSWTPGSQAARQSPYALGLIALDGTTTSTAWVSIAVQAVNAPPEVLAPDPWRLTLAEGEVTRLFLQAADEDGDAVVFSAQGLEALPFSASIGGNELVFDLSDTYEIAAERPCPDNPISGTDRCAVLVLASDGDLDGTATLELDLLDVSPPEIPDPGQEPANSPPTMTVTGPGLALPDDNVAEIEEGDTLMLAIEAVDPDGDEVTVVALERPAGAELLRGSATAYAFTWTPDQRAGDASPYGLVLVASDGRTSRHLELEIDVGVVNLEPQLEVSSPWEASVVEGHLTLVPVPVSDQDGDVLTIELEGADDLPFEASLTSGGSIELDLIERYDVAGEAPCPDNPISGSDACALRVVVSDGELADSAVLALELFESAPPDDTEEASSPPSMTVTGPGLDLPSDDHTEVDEGDSLALTVTVSDPDGDDVIVIALDQPTDATLESSSASEYEFSWSPDQRAANESPYRLLLLASDGTRSTYQSILIEVEAVNLSPELDVPSEWTESVVEDEVTLVPLSVSDPDGDELSIELQGTEDLPFDARHERVFSGHRLELDLSDIFDAAGPAPCPGNPISGTDACAIRVIASDGDRDDEAILTLEIVDAPVTVPESCDPFVQDCPEDYKCTAWANDGGSAWNANVCRDVPLSPNQPGDPCTVEGSGASGIDDCDVGSICFFVDSGTLLGTCTAFCTGDELSPACDSPDEDCSIFNDAVLPLCFPVCDPLLQDCASGETCLASLNGPRFSCTFDASGSAGAYGDPCAFVNACDPGLTCADAPFVPDCTDASCCTPFCDLAEANACPGMTDGQDCIPWYESGSEPPGYDQVGFCGIPP